MKAVERKLNKAQIVTIWLLIISVLLAGAYVISIVIVNSRAKNGTDSSSGNTVLDIREGESSYLNSPIAYPRVSEAEILFIEIDSKGERYGVSRYPDDDGSFLFHYYEDGKKEAIPYVPPIVNAEGKFDYESLYAIETGDGFGKIYYLTYLCSALGTPFFSERIDLPSADTPEGKEKRELLLKNYGLTESESTTIGFEYCKRDSETNEKIEDSEDWHVIIVGGKALSDSGFYFMVDGRDCVYYTNSEYFAYALGGFSSFIKGTLISAGLSQDSLYGPYLTTDFKSWMGELFEKESDRVFTSDMSGYEKYENPTVVVKGDYKTSIDKGLDFDPGADAFSGYQTAGGAELKFDLEALRKHPSYTRIKNALVGKNVGIQNDKIIITLLDEIYNSDEKLISFGEADSVNYLYEILAIESVLTDNGEKTSGTIDASDTLVKVTYRYTVGGQTVKHDCHAVIDITNLKVGERDKFIGKAIGTPLGTDAFTVSVDYTKEAGGALKSTEKYVLTGILSIFDGNGAVADTVTEDTYVNISYYIQVDGVKGSTQTTIVRLADIKDTDRLASFKTILIGKEKGSYNETVYNSEYRYEFMREFVTYEISEIEYFVANEIIVSFRFYQDTDTEKRDPFYGESIYKNTLDNKYGIYGLNDGTCQSLVELLGGIGADDTSSTAEGLSGETVAIGLTLTNMKEYGLYAHKIYFEMPRGIFDASEGEEDSDENDLSVFDWVSTIGFTLYISDTKTVGGEKIRYIGSDMYDVIVKVPAADFDFVEYEFVEFWGRRDMIMIDIKKLDEIKFDFNMEDLQGSYTFNISFKTVYSAYIDGKYVISEENIEGYSPIQYQTVMVKASENAFDTEYKRLFPDATKWGNLASLYDVTIGGGKESYYPGSTTTSGAAYFNSVYESLMFTKYHDCLTEEEQAAGFSMPKVMSMRVKVDGSDDYYVYDFYRIDDRRVMVSLYTTDSDGTKNSEAVSDFYISTFAFKKIVNNYIHLLNGEPVDENMGYPEI